MCFESIITEINSYKKFDQELAISFFKQKKMIHVKQKVCVLNYLIFFKAVHQNNSQIHSPQQNKKIL